MLSIKRNNGLYNAEVIYKGGPWRGLEDVERATLAWVAWFNKRRRLRLSVICRLLNLKGINKLSQAMSSDSDKTALKLP